MSMLSCMQHAMALHPARADIIAVPDWNQLRGKLLPCKVLCGVSLRALPGCAAGSHCSHALPMGHPAAAGQTTSRPARGVVGLTTGSLRSFWNFDTRCEGTKRLELFVGCGDSVLLVDAPSPPRNSSASNRCCVLEADADARGEAGSGDDCKASTRRYGSMLHD